MTLQGLDHGLFFLVADLQGDDVGKESFIFSGPGDVLVGNRQGDGVFITAIENGGYIIVQTTQAAARTFPQVSPD